MSAEGSNATGNLSREGPARRGHQGGRSGHHQDYNAPQDPSHRGQNPAHQLRQGNASTNVQYRDMDHRYHDGRPERDDPHGRNYQGRSRRDNKDPTSRLAANFSRGVTQRTRPVVQRPRAMRDRLFEDYVRQPQQEQQRQAEQQQKQRLRQQNKRQEQPERRDSPDRMAASAGASRNRPASRDDSGVVASARDGGGSERGSEKPPSESNLTQQMSKLNVHAQEFTPSVSTPAAGTPAHDGAPHEVSAPQRGVASDRNGCRGDGSESAKAMAMMMAMADLRRGPSRYAMKKRPAEESKAQKESMEEQLLKSSYDCLICCSRIRNVQAIWNCQACFHIFHLRCVAEWAQTSLSVEVGTWRCPACQGESAELPNDYHCFCGKQKNPPPSKMSLPHSCTELCQKARPCPHKCNSLCHPGRCPPCEATVSRRCQCGKSSKQVKCNSKIALNCDQPCGRTLSCGKHNCSRVCHSGECDSCEETKEARCVCGKNAMKVLCAMPNEYSCDEPCELKMSCGNHDCEKKCHRRGECRECPLSAVKSCPCGRSPLPGDWNCAKPVPLCEAKCRRRLKDCEHFCENNCHEGECAPCPAPVKGRRCRCGALVEEAQCGEKVLVCRRRCNKKKTCGRHKCLDECCDKEFHICDLICGKKLSCGLHTCAILCHKGTCPKCDNVSFDELRCDCGYSVVFPPVACNAPPPECAQLCGRVHRCTHPVTHPCHSDVTCPPCTSLTEKKCHGGHEVRRNIPCHLDNVSCGRPCGRPLLCGRHACDKTCHAGECPTACEQPCKKLRKCGHPCKLPCHDECPISTCFTQVEVTCSCGRLVEPRNCHEFQQAVSNMVQQKMRRGEEVNLAKDLSQLSKGFLKCVERCAQEERSRRMAEALKIDPDVPVFTLALYSDFVKEEARKNWHFASKIVTKLNELVELAKNSSQTSRSYGFEPMPREQRRFIYELLEVYRCTGQSYDQEPKRNIVVTAYREKSTIPSMSLASAIGIVNPIPLRKM